MRVALIVDSFLRRRTSDGFGPGLGGVAVVMLVLLMAVAMSQAATGAETHAAPAAPGEIPFTHN